MIRKRQTTLTFSFLLSILPLWILPPETTAANSHERQKFTQKTLHFECPRNYGDKPESQLEQSSKSSEETAYKVFFKIVQLASTGKMKIKGGNSNRENAWANLAAFFAPLPQWRRTEVVLQYCRENVDQKKFNPKTADMDEIDECLRLMFNDPNGKGIGRLKRPNMLSGLLLQMYDTSARMFQLLIKPKARALGELLFDAMEPKGLTSKVHLETVYDILLASTKTELLQLMLPNAYPFKQKLAKIYGSKHLANEENEKHSRLQVHLELKITKERDVDVKRILRLLLKRLEMVRGHVDFNGRDTLDELFEQIKGKKTHAINQLMANLEQLLTQFDFSSKEAFGFGDKFHEFAKNLDKYNVALVKKHVTVVAAKAAAAAEASVAAFAAAKAVEDAKAAAATAATAEAKTAADAKVAAITAAAEVTNAKKTAALAAEEAAQSRAEAATLSATAVTADAKEAAGQAEVKAKDAEARAVAAAKALNPNAKSRRFWPWEKREQQHAIPMLPSGSAVSAATMEVHQPSFSQFYWDQLMRMLHVAGLTANNEEALHSELAKRLQKMHLKGDNDGVIRFLVMHLGNDLAKILAKYPGEHKQVEKDLTTFFYFTRMKNRLFDFAYSQMLAQAWPNLKCYVETEKEYSLDMAMDRMSWEKPKFEKLLDVSKILISIGKLHSLPSSNEHHYHHRECANEERLKNTRKYMQEVFLLKSADQPVDQREQIKVYAKELYRHFGLEEKQQNDIPQLKEKQKCMLQVIQEDFDLFCGHQLPQIEHAIGKYLGVELPSSHSTSMASTSRNIKNTATLADLLNSDESMKETGDQQREALKKRIRKLLESRKDGALVEEWFLRSAGKGMREQLNGLKGICQRIDKVLVNDKALDSVEHDNIVKSLHKSDTNFMAQLQQWAQNTVQKELQALKDEFVYPLQNMKPSAQFVLNWYRNRYYEIPCVENTRVQLHNGRYIHANWISDEQDGGERRFMCTQGPLPVLQGNPNSGTVDEFWTMVVQERIEAIVMVTDTVERGTAKSAQYWPLDNLTQSIIKSKREGSNLRVEFRSQEKLDEHLFRTELHVVLDNQQMTVQHFHWRNWPDHGVPMNQLAQPLQLLHHLASYQRVVVHCSAGVGRTGTIMAIHLALNHLRSAGHQQPLNLPDLLQRLRQQRAHSVQTLDQYLYVYSVLLSYAKTKLHGEDVDAADRLLKEITESIYKPPAPAAVAQNPTTGNTAIGTATTTTGDGGTGSDGDVNDGGGRVPAIPALHLVPSAQTDIIGTTQTKRDGMVMKLFRRWKTKIDKKKERAAATRKTSAAATATDSRTGNVAAVPVSPTVAIAPNPHANNNNAPPISPKSTAVVHERKLPTPPQSPMSNSAQQYKLSFSKESAGKFLAQMEKLRLGIGEADILARKKHFGLEIVNGEFVARMEQFQQGNRDNYFADTCVALHENDAVFTIFTNLAHTAWAGHEEWARAMEKVQEVIQVKLKQTSFAETSQEGRRQSQFFVQNMMMLRVLVDIVLQLLKCNNENMLHQMLLLITVNENLLNLRESSFQRSKILLEHFGTFRTRIDKWLTNKLLEQNGNVNELLDWFRDNFVVQVDGIIITQIPEDFGSSSKIQTNEASGSGSKSTFGNLSQPREHERTNGQMKSSTRVEPSKSGKQQLSASETNLSDTLKWVMPGDGQLDEEESSLAKRKGKNVLVDEGPSIVDDHLKDGTAMT